MRDRPQTPQRRSRKTSHPPAETGAAGRPVHQMLDADEIFENITRLFFFTVILNLIAEVVIGWILL